MNRTISTLLLTAALTATACGSSSSGRTTPTAPAAPTAPSTATPAAAGELTSAEQVLEASLVAQGGRARLTTLKSLKQSGSLLIPQMGIKGTLTVLAAPPRSVLTNVQLPGLGVITQGVHGDVAWEVNAMTGARLVTGKELAQQLRDSTFNSELQWKQLYPKAELAGVVQRGGVAAYKVVMTATDGSVQTRYIAKDTLLPVGVEMTVHSQMGDIPVDVGVSDYRDVNGLKFPHKMVRTEGPQKIEIVFDKIELDVAVPPATFDVPPAIRALQKGAAPAASTAPAATPATPTKR